jgi:hypothetical protein
MVRDVVSVPAPRSTWLSTRTLLPVTMVLTVGFAVISELIGGLADPDAIMRQLSTNIVNLTHMPVRSLVASAFVGSGPWWVNAALVAVALGLLERRYGSLRALAVFASGHVIATLLTEGGVWVGVHEGWLPLADRDQIDVGISYGMWAAIGAALVLLPRRWRLLVIPIGLVGVVVPFALAPGMTSTGHVLSLAIGVAWWPYLLRRTRTTAASTAVAVTD